MDVILSTIYPLIVQGKQKCTVDKSGNSKSEDGKKRDSAWKYIPPTDERSTIKVRGKISTIIVLIVYVKKLDVKYCTIGPTLRKVTSFLVIQVLALILQLIILVRLHLHLLLVLVYHL